MPTDFVQLVRNALGVTAGIGSWQFSAFLFLHLISLIVGFGAVLVTDAMGLLWATGRRSSAFMVHTLAVTQPIIWAGFAGLVLTGSALIVLKGHVDALTSVKLFLVLMIGLNGIALHFVKKELERLESYEKAPAVYKYHVIATAVISQIGWWGAIAIGFIHNNVAHYIPWPAHAGPYLLGIALFWLALVLVGQIWLAAVRRRW